MVAQTTEEPLGLVLDTDIGTDVDDLLALALILGSPELALRGVTTVYGDVLLRARIVLRALRMAGGPAVPVAPGRSDPRSGREVFWAGHEGRLMPDLDQEDVDGSRDGVALLAGNPLAVAIGPLTDLGEAVAAPGTRIDRAVVMGGDFAAGEIEHNVKCDVDAAVTVFESGVPLTVVGIDQTERVALDRSAADRIRAAGALGEIIAAEMRQFEDFLGRGHTVPHDPLAVLTLVRPDLFRFEQGRVRVQPAGPEAGRTDFTPDPEGPHRVVTDVEADAASEEILRRVLAGIGDDRP
jgi:purine nucleosidase